MSCVLYYSKYCKNSNNVLKFLGKSDLQNSIHFLCIDKRRRDEKGNLYIILDNGMNILLPKNIEQVPALLLLNKNKIIFGEKNILDFFKPKVIKTSNLPPSMNNIEPLAYSTYEMGCTLSDNYSYLDQSSEELLAKGSGGTRQIHSFSKIDEEHKINTPPDDYIPDKVGTVDFSKIREQRNNEINKHFPDANMKL
tara:strand:- start:20 stop:604 length:585 start_codon:yes stop_codon:yes gene_type:complete